MKEQTKQQLALIILLSLTALFLLLFHHFDKSHGKELHEDALLENDVQEVAPIEEDGLPYDKLFITVERQKYQDGDLTLRIPKLNVERSVLNGVDLETLKHGVGLYDYAQLPGEGNRNVSIAGHRNGIHKGKITDGAPFYYIDTLKQGDYLYLADKERIYRYLYHDTEIVEANDWGPIYSQGYSCLTLTSCHPIGVSDHRIIVRGELDQIFQNQEDFSYLANKPD